MILESVQEMEETRQTEELNRGAEQGMPQAFAKTGAASPSRQAGFDVLRCVAMMMVVVLHFLGKGGLLGDVTASDMGAVGLAAWVLEAFCIVAVNVYMLISGYFLCMSSFKLSRLLRLYLQVWLYSVGIGLLAVAFGIAPAAEVDTHYFISLLFPVSMGHYWFMTAYLFLYLLLPFLGYAVKNMTKQQLSLGLTFLLVVFCALKSVLPFRLEEDGMGYDCLWYVCVFLAAAYIRRFGLRFLESRVRCALLYVGGCLALLAEMLVFRQVYLRSGSLGLILKVSFEYNHLFALLAALGLFGLFRSGAERAAGGTEQANDEVAAQAGKIGGLLGRWAGKAAPYVLGVYLLHENLGLRYGWQKWFGAGRIQSIPQLLLGTAAAVLCIFITGVILEWLRSLAVGGIHSLLLHWGLYRKVTAGVEKADEIFKK